MSTRALLVAMPFAAVFMALAPAAADESAELLMAAQAAICGPELKGLSVNGHDFNVKEATIGLDPRDPTTFVVAGQISHRLAVFSDDQVYYTINYKNGVPDETDIQIDHGGVASIVDVWIDAITFFGLVKIEIAEGTEFELSLERLPEIATEISNFFQESEWEYQVGAMIACIGVAATLPADDFCAMDIPASGGGGGGGGGSDGPPRHQN